MTSDRELLERAAMAAGHVLVWRDDQCWIPTARPPHNRRRTDQTEGVLWNPLEDDADALQLAVELRLTVDVGVYCCKVTWVHGMSFESFSTVEDWGTDEIGLSERMARVRLAIVRAAAAA